MADESLAYFNGRLLPAGEVALSLDDLGFVWGATVADRLRTFRHKLFRLDDHLKRFRRSCELAFVTQPRSDRELATAAEELIAANARLLPADAELSLLLFATPGLAGEPTLGMQTRTIDFARDRHLFMHGAVLEPVANSSDMLDPHIKHRSRLGWWIAEQRLRINAKPSNCEPLFTSASPERLIRETARANFLAVIDGKVISPPRSEILEGISLQVIEELCGKLGIAFMERELLLAEVQTIATECLLSNTSYCLAPVGIIGGISKSIVGPTFQRLLSAWSDQVGVDIRRQFST